MLAIWQWVMLDRQFEIPREDVGVWGGLSLGPGSKTHLMARGSQRFAQQC